MSIPKHPLNDITICYDIEGVFMLVKLFDEEHERDLEIRVNDFLRANDNIKIIDIKYQTAILYDEREQIYSFSCLIMYEKN